VENIKLTNKEIKETVIEMLNDAKGIISDDSDVIEDDNDEEDGIGMISYDLLWVSAAKVAIENATGANPSKIKDDTYLFELLLMFKKLKGHQEEFNKEKGENKKEIISDKITRTIEALDDISNHIIDEDIVNRNNK